MSEHLPSTRLYSRGFVSLLLTQFLGAANDNVLKTVLSFMVVSGVWKGALGEGGQGWVSLGLTLPFILFSGYGGQLSDRFSKSNVVMGVKITEIPIAITAGVGLWLDNLPITLCAFIALAIQSSFFGPAKYGIIPELVVERHLSRANGAINMFTNVAVITGTLIAGPISMLYFPSMEETDRGGTGADRMAWLPFVTMVLIALGGLGFAFLMPKLKPGKPNLRFDFNPFSTYFSSIREMAKTPLLGIAIGWAYFYLIGMIGLLVLLEYQTFLNVSYTRASVLFAILAIAVGMGSALAGYLSGDRIQPKFVRFGAAGLTVFFLLLGWVMPGHFGTGPDSYYWLVACMLVGAGISAGFYIVPLQALIQDLSPEGERGRFIGTTNAISFVFTSAAGVIIIVLRQMLGVPPNRVFLVCSALSLIGILFAVLFLKSMRAALYAHVDDGSA